MFREDKMLANVIDLFSKKQDEHLSELQPQALKDVSINSEKPKRKNFVFNRLLVKELEGDHSLLLSNYDKLMECAKEGNFLLLSRLLEDFTVVIINHLNKEDNELYGYLEEIIKEKNKTEIKVFRKFRSEMKNISVTIFSTINQNPNIPVTSDTVDGFIADFAQMGEILIDRIKREEDVLYPMYRRSRKVVNIS